MTNTPVKVAGPGKEAQAAEYDETPYALDSYGAVWAWGRKRAGSLGQGYGN